MLTPEERTLFHVPWRISRRFFVALVQPGVCWPERVLRRWEQRTPSRTDVVGKQRVFPRETPYVYPSVKYVFASCIAFAGYDNDPSAGSPTETLLRLLLPLNDKVQWTSRDVASSEPPTSPRSEHFTGPFNR